ncbi:MAG: type III pantothenate kinase [Planctomycetota bacterium]
MSDTTKQTDGDQGTDGGGLRLIAVAVGNTRHRIGRFEDGALSLAGSVPSGDDRALADALGERLSEGPAALVYSSVSEENEARLVRAAGDRFAGVYRVGRDLPIPITHNLLDETTVGHDRLLCALAAYQRAQSACLVVDAGTAVTIDFVDGTGGFQGGAIMPGLAMMLAALHDGTSQLPALEPGRPAREDTPWGRDTADAMRVGVRAAVIGGVRLLLERYADAFGGYPRVIATGGDAASLFDGDEVVEHIVPDLQLMGIEAACREALDLDQDA